MKRIDEIMGSLGFKAEADDSVKAAFIKNLIKQAYGVNVEVPDKYRNDNTTPSKDRASGSPARDIRSTLKMGGGDGAMDGACVAPLATPIQLAFDLEVEANIAG
jgi:hypothetical protein